MKIFGVMRVLVFENDGTMKKFLNDYIDLMAPFKGAEKGYFEDMYFGKHRVLVQFKNIRAFNTIKNLFDKKVYGKNYIYYEFK